MNWRNIFGRKKEPAEENKDYSTIVLGEKLPWEPYQKTGDWSTVMLTEDSFNIIISLANLSEQEEEAIGDKEFEMYLTPADCIPFLIVKFGDVFKTDLTINVAKMTADRFYHWIHSKNNMVTLYLLEGLNAKLKCMRYFEYPHMSMIRRICEDQQKHSIASIDNAITQVYSHHSVEDLMQQARCLDYIPAVEYHL